jgi:tetratricopeptide (TPR) repeat protein
MFKVLAAGISLLTVVTFVACSSKEKVEAERSADKAAWQGKMQGMSEALSKLLPMLGSPREFSNPSNYDSIEKNTKALAATAHAVNMTSDSLSKDPSLPFVSGKFVADMNEAVRQLDLGNRRFARQLLRNSTSYCIACHTRTDEGRKNLNLSMTSDVSALRALDRAEYHMALRDFDAALGDFERVLNSPDSQIESPQAMEQAAEKTLAVTVRVKQDPVASRKVIDKIINSTWAPVYLKLNATAWRTAIDEWSKEKPVANRTPSQQLLRAKNLLARGWRFSSSSPQSRAGLVYFLRASSILHDLLGNPSKNPAYGEGLYYAGLAAESLRDINLWTLQDAYYEACIRKQPYTTMAKKCYLRLEALQLSAYADADGAYVPAHVKDHLRELRGLAEKGEGSFLDWGSVD